VSDDPLRDLTPHSLNAHEVQQRRDVHLAAAEAAAFAVQMPGHNQCDRESAERCGAPHGERHAVAGSEMVERWVASAWLLKGEQLPQNRWPSRSVGVVTILGLNLYFSQSQEKLA